MNIDGVRTGVVLDHIKAGKSMMVYELLGLDKVSNCVAIIQNADSSKYGKKDIIKIDKMIDINIDAIGFVDPNITVNYIKGGQLAKRKHFDMPDEIEGFVKCKNPRCITTVEQELPHRFRLTDREKGVYRCIYCESKLER